ncbi:MAG TPA: GTP pyrophosphokinase family protein [Candidatus Scatovivens faecipullorum]|nr:GTP pyrophosphokinase family protein [Candidatus Scatovivens faecipullorum]
MSENENEYLINMEGNLVNKELIDINDENFKKVMFLYSSALKEIKTKMEILQDELRIFSNYEPIEYITTRLKKPETIIEKLKRKNCELTYENMFEKINDIAGIRIVCNFKKDVYKLVEIIEDFQDIRILNRKDFMKKPKQSGYMSYHLITEVPVNFSSGIMFVKVEIQLRTLGMDFWASIEHKLKYKNPNIGKTESKNLIKYARVINNIDENMLMISNILDKEREQKIMIEASQNDDNIKNKKFNFKL